MITTQDALRIAIEHAISTGASKSDIEDMQQDVHDEGETYVVTIYPKDGQQNYDLSYTIDKETGAILHEVMGTLEEE
jgi:hypothetical protein